MFDSLRKKNPSGREINLDGPYEIRQWVKELNCTEPQLRSAIKAVGHSATDVEHYLKTH
jgi:hypothetical protein